TERLPREVASLTGGVAVGAADVEPYSFGASRNVFRTHGREVETENDEVTPGLKDALELDLVAGRWFVEGDRGLAYRPVVINRTLARAVFGAANPVGQELEPPSLDQQLPGRRVIGVVSEFRGGGELSGPVNYVFQLHRPGLPRARH